MKSFTQLARLSAFALCAAFLSNGCSQPPSLPDLFSVKGKVVRAGKAVTKGLLLLDDSKLQEAFLTVNGEIGADGEFELSTASSKAKKRMPGVPAGSYRATFMDPGDGQMVKTTELSRPFVVEAKDNVWTIDLSRK
jgi:hypothetical protein